MMIRLVLFLLLSNTAMFCPFDAIGGVFVTAGTGISTTSYVHFYFEDGAGHRTGRLPNGQIVAEIPGTGGRYGTSTDGDIVADTPGSETVIFHSSAFPAGQFRLVLLPLATTSFWLKFDIENNNGSVSENDFTGFGVVGTTIAYNFEYQPTASSPTAVSKSVTFASLRQSVQAALLSAQLGDAGFVSRLDKMLAKAQARAAAGKARQSADRLDQFIHRLDSAFKKEADHSEGDDSDDLKTASAMKRFVSSQALDSLSADARTLIRSLGEVPKR